MDVNNNYVTEGPSNQLAVDIFSDSWASHVPLADVTSGAVGLFADARLEWLFDFRGRLDGMKILELGPLEAGHTYMMEHAGADSILGIEANRIAYLKCLIVKELMDLKKAKFVLGNFDRYLENTDERFDLVLASGVLYHLTDPLQTLLNMMKVTNEIFIWTHFFDDVAMPVNDPRRQSFTGETVDRTIGDDVLTYHLRSYGGNNHPSLFSGGVMSGSVWVPKAQVVGLLEKYGFAVTLSFEQNDHVNGPAACLHAVKR